jgi:hypothetical protein
MSNKRMTADEIAKMVGVSRYQIDIARKQGRLPYIQFGRRIYFDPEMVEKALDLEAVENQQRQKELAEAEKPKEVVHYGKFKSLRELME